MDVASTFLQLIDGDTLGFENRFLRLIFELDITRPLAEWLATIQAPTKVLWDSSPFSIIG